MIIIILYILFHSISTIKLLITPILTVSHTFVCDIDHSINELKVFCRELEGLILDCRVFVLVLFLISTRLKSSSLTDRLDLLRGAG